MSWIAKCGISKLDPLLGYTEEKKVILEEKNLLWESRTWEKTQASAITKLQEKVSALGKHISVIGRVREKQKLQ